MKKTKCALLVLAVVALLLPGTAGAVVNPSPNFCGAFGQIITNSLLSLLPPEFADLINLFQPATADLNGTSVVDTNEDPLLIDIHGNGILDCSAEMMILQNALSNTTLNLPGGLTHTMAVDAWNRNWMSLETCVGALYASLLPSLAGGLMEIIVGYATIGDGEFTEDPAGRYTVTGSAGFIQALLSVLASEGFLDPTAPEGIEFVSNTQYWTLLPDYLGPCGDADNDGVNNINEYYGQNKSDSAYVAAALNPAVAVCGNDPNSICGSGGCATEGEGEGEGEIEPFIKGGGWVEVGQPVTLTVVGAVPPATFAWKKNGAAVGTNSSTFSLASAVLADSGNYTCDVTDASAGKAVYTLGPVPVTVVEQGTLPVAAVGGLALAAMACAAAGAFVLRRK